MVKAYLTIDDSPSADFMGKVEFLAAKKIPAIFFCRGDLLEKRSDEVIKAIQMGFVAGSHSYLHKRHSTLSITEASAAIRKNDELLDNIYAKAGVQRTLITAQEAFLAHRKTLRQRKKVGLQR